MRGCVIRMGHELTRSRDEEVVTLNITDEQAPLETLLATMELHMREIVRDKEKQ